MKILVTGAKGFVGKNLIAELKNKGYEDILEFDIETEKYLLDSYTKECEFVFHLAGVNRPKNEMEFIKGNFEFTSELLDLLKKNNNKSPILITSSVQANMDNPYGVSKKGAEDVVIKYGLETGAPVYVYRLTNVFGKWCKHNYNSVIATWCYNIPRELPIKINNPDAELKLVYIDDVVFEFLNALKAEVKRSEDGFCFVPRNFTVTLRCLANTLYSFKKSRKTLLMMDLEGEFERFLYATYLSYLPEDDFGYDLETKQDNRGWLAEFLKSNNFGQIFISRTKPGITRGNHWHHTKVEKFLVIEGKALIEFRQVNGSNITKYKVSGEKLKVVDIPAGYTHSITNIGQTDLITLFWAVEIFDPKKPDTFYLEV